MSNRIKSLLYKVATAVAVIIVVFVGLLAIGASLQKGEERRQRIMDNRASFVARCKSVDGIIGGDKCYVNGEVVFSE